MARYENKTLGVAFETPDVITVGMRMRYLGVLGIAGLGVVEETEDHYFKMWKAAKVIITKVESEYMTLDVDLDNCSDTRVAKAIIWIVYEVSKIVYKQDEVPKN